MKKQLSKALRTGFSLIELLLVVAILAILTALVLPKLDGLQSKANHGVGAASADDLGRQIQIFRTTKQRFPDGWDSLMDTSGTDMWKQPTPTTAGVHPSLTGSLNPASRKLGVTTLSAGQLSSLQRMGITTVYHLGTFSGTAPIPGDRFNSPAPLADGSSVAFVDPTNAGGKKIIDHIYPKNSIPGTGVSGALPANKTLVVFGFGPRNDLIGTTMLECPFYPNVDMSLIYNRNLVVFEVDGNGGRADFKAVLGTDGDLLSDMANDVFK